ncbi:MAG: hypothetical protein UV73_C0003G0079 [Candidatus Gottesmanbacteria bacterium GW2011_GWA2_43_14]|uniref:Uncharacterized protein n=1 Tax=Candidatus Gottesmanbacteria bacterium GW2011_GWA2_43_14 TaxID=1618443 RepID=A0A0G1DKQ4_9BACT|nr:MAG: hypothetical protein UV73_C0003G0079 [Candidatus Gottesmanbacteria bacterium GW2011_GWA2_43_14]
MIAAIDFFYIAIGFGFLIASVSLAVTLVALTRTVMVAKKIIEDVEDTTRDIKLLKSGLKVGLLSMATKVIGYFANKKSQNERG